MKKLINPFNKQDSLCFGCSTKNPFGLKMEFYEDGDFIVSKWGPNKFFQGYNNVLHGGIQATLIDEIASWVVFIKKQTGGVTIRMNVNYRKPVFTNKGELFLRARLVSSKKKTATMEVELLNHSQIVCTEAEVVYFIKDPEVAKKKLGYPELSEFYESS